MGNTNRTNSERRKRAPACAAKGRIPRVGALVPVLLLVLCGAGCDQNNQSGSPPGSVSIELLYEDIPGSTHHSPNGTWWGHNQSKIVRNGDYVFMAVVENENIDNGDPNADNPSHMAIYVKTGEADWTKGASFPCSRPGNVVIGSDGILHAIVFEPTSSQDNGSVGKLMHYSFPDASSGDINTYTTETVIGNDGSSETVNIRVGAAMSPGDTLALAFGLNVGANHTEQFYYKQPHQSTWTNLTAGENLGHDFYYPYVVAEDSNYWLLPIQDDYNPATGGNFYQIIPIFSYDGTDWTQEIIIDLTSHALASERERLLSQCDLFQDSNGTIHVYYNELLDESVAYHSSAIKHVHNGNGTWESTKMGNMDSSINWVRAIEYDDALYYFCASWDKVFLKKGDDGELFELDGPDDITGIYPYISSPRGGTGRSEQYIDVLLLNGDSDAYPNAKNYYLRIAKSELTKVE